MDSRKRPRSSTPTKEETTPTKKKSKRDKLKTKKTKQKRSSSAEGSTTNISTTKTNKNSMDSTATTDGQMMAQMLSTFSKLEQSRFEAFQRVSFPVDAVGDWVAACLSNRLKLIDNGNNNNKRALEDLVAVGQAGEIRTVVACLAKIYAQRLVQEASRLAANSSKGTDTTPQSTTSSSQCLQPSHILRAYEGRSSLGLDPGFFMQNPTELPSFVLEPKESFEQRRLAAFEAQEEYDRQQQQQESSAAKEKGDSTSSMDVDKA
mmetsp:Transcript_5343/g.6985  ORF Transcript_5343/g.6985 Transcript_5343/m.6985 type:complete len:262 (+) Transcript_5343:93-878(+)|eukprot:CAMPEP_0198150006 /NCGR_PEP_ID=MMETSP1443-20131203/48997_1 /TAXON_ID=186043 /ORGANISM="Entomoneis sp., Strain CCMP2396" /LENGTH=261 /DNA_ID=CAMNT_0043815189 /DNA_START=40 /DNA_END=825 /DNA_ORIENTATION=-